ncbi:MAG: hypothetical protein WDN75_02925 [Bacteroidota bacterium]
MKKVSLILVMLLTGIIGQAQEFPVAWKSKFSIGVDNWSFDDDGKNYHGPYID